MNKHPVTRLLSLLLVIALLAGFAVPVHGTERQNDVTWTQVDNSEVSVELLQEADTSSCETQPYQDSDMVRVSIVLDGQSTMKAGFSMQNLANNAEAVAYRTRLEENQNAVAASISRTIGNQLDVVWNLTLAANIISANVQYGQIEAIESVPGVSRVLIETRYEPDVVAGEDSFDPNMATSSKQIGSTVAWEAGYTGAGSRVAVIDTGADINHQSFDPEAFLYSLAYRAEELGMTVESYMEGLNLLDAEEIASVADQLNVSVDAQKAYVNAKMAFGYNYVDGDYDVVHLNDQQGEHGSHVSGIATANAFIKNADGSFVPALSSVFVQGVAPDAQLINMKVFGKKGGAYDADYMAAIEDAIILGADAVNLSLGSGNPGMSRCATAEYQAIMEEITKSGTVVAMSGGNSGNWVESAANNGYLYAGDVSMQTDGTPGSYTNALTSASVDNDGITGAFVSVGDHAFIYSETYYTNEPFSTIAGEHEYVLIDGFGSASDWAAVGEDLVGKIALCTRGGGLSFYVKAEEAVNAGAIATFICNNQEGILNMNLASYSKTAPVAALTMEDTARIKADSTAVTDEAGNVRYYTGTMTVSAGMSAVQKNSPYYTMSDFSSWGVPGSLELKPEITTPGGSIYSVYGETPSGGGFDQYVVKSGTSMASPQTAGMTALLAQYIRENGLEEKTGLSIRQLAQSLLMSTAVPMVDGNSDVYYPVLQQGAGLANVGDAVSADSYILMAENANAGAADGKIKVELGDDPARTGSYGFSFTINNLTDEEKAFGLSADFFTQNVFQDYANSNRSEEEMAYYMDKLAAWLAVDVAWTANGIALNSASDMDGMDFDGNGCVNTADGQRLLNHVVDRTVDIENVDRADLDNDGDVDTHDAYLFFSELNRSAVLVAPNGSVTVDVTVELTEEQKVALNEAFPNGAYVQGYVFAESVADAEGVQGTSHSIPVLGFYGNWSDPSMYDVGTHQEYAAGDENRTPYLGNEDANAYLIGYAKDPEKWYYFGGNPLVPDETYMPERNAINGTNGDRIGAVQFTAIRNAAASKFRVESKTTGEVYGESELGEVPSAFYHGSNGYWMNTNYTMNTSVRPTGLPEGEVLEMTLTLAPEYYMDAEGNVNWDALGKGADFSIPMVVDNTAPALKSVSLDFMTNTMKIVASDNEYVAAVGLFNKSGTVSHTIVGAKQDIEKNTDAEYVLNLDGVNGKRFLVQVFDYAMNVSTYLVEMQIGEPVELPEMIAYDRTKGYWTNFTKDSKVDRYTGMPVYQETDLVFYAGTIVDHMVLASTENGDLYIMPEDDLSDLTYVNNMGAVVTDMAYNKADGKVYGVAEGNLVTIDKMNGKLTVLGKIGIPTTTLACDADGNFYCHYEGASAIYTFTADTWAEPAVLISEIYCDELYQALRCSDVQAMEINPNTGMLCWSSLFVWSVTWSYCYYVEIDPENGTYKIYNDLSDEFTALLIPERTTSSGGDWTAPTDKMDGISISESEVTMLRNTEYDLNATVHPWSTTDRSVTWTTSDATIATVDDKGLVSAHKAGTAVITATSNLDPSFSASCTVTVEILDVTIKGMLQDENGKAEFFTWNMATEDTWTAGKEIDTDMTAAALNTTDGTYYVMDAERDVWAMHKVNKEGVTVANSGANANGSPVWDMTYSTYFSEVKEQDMIAAVSGYYVLLPKDPMHLDMKIFDMYWYLDKLVGITTLGHESRYDDWHGVWRETEHFVLICNYGYIYDLWVYDNNGSMGAMIDYRESDLTATFEIYENLYMYSSFVAGEDGALYLSAFNGETNDIYRFVYNEKEDIYNATRLGDVGQDVWPAIITEVTSNGTSAKKNTTDMAFPESARRLEAQTATMEDLTHVATNAETEIVNGEETATVTIKTDVAATNGLTTVTYDETKLKLEETVVHGDYTAKVEEAGKLTFGYVSMTEIPVDGTVATLTFTVLDAVATEIVVEYEQVNNKAGSAEMLFVTFDHNNTEVRGAVEATCTEEGYTGDTYCLDCGKLVAEGEAIPALGHSTELVGAKEATCTEDGYTGDLVCTVCGEVLAEGEVIAASCPAESFTDVDTTKWYHEGICFVLRNGYMKGVGEGIFAPNANLTRAELVTVLYRMEDKPTVEGLSNPFTDVAADTWYAEAVIWAAANGIVKGLDDTTFAPNAKVTREQIATILYRYAGAEKVEEDALADFTDAATVSDWAKDAMNWAVSNGLINGLEDNTLAPTGNATRAQITTILMRYLEG